MKPARRLSLLLFLSLVGLASLQARQGSASTEATIAALENQWLKSQQTNNPDLAAPLLASKFAYTSEEGKLMDAAQYLADARATKYTAITYEKTRIDVFGGTAVTRGEAKSTGTDASGKAMDGHVRFTDTWVKMPGGTWQCVASHTFERHDDVVTVWSAHRQVGRSPVASHTSVEQPWIS